MKYIAIFMLSILALFALTQYIDNLRHPIKKVETLNGYTFQLLNDSTYAVTGYTGKSTTLNIPGEYKNTPVTQIGYSAFRSLHIEDVIIPDSITTIGGFAFAESTLNSIDIPDSVTNINELAFQTSKLLTNISVTDNNSQYSSNEGILYSKDESIIIKYPEGRKGYTYTLPNNVTKIGDYAFSMVKNLKEVTIDDFVTTIGTYAFYNAQNLNNLIIPNSVTEIGDHAFYDISTLTNITLSNQITSIEESLLAQTSITSITIPNGVTSIGKEAFKSSKLKSINIPTSVTDIGESAFNGILTLDTITIPANVNSLGEGAFFNMAGLQSINVDPNNENYTSIDGVLYTKDVSRLLYYPGGKTETDYIVPDLVTSLAKESLLYAPNLTTVTIPASVTSIEAKVFLHSINTIIINCLTPPEISENTFISYNNYDVYKIYVPTISVDIYKNVNNWPKNNIFPIE